MGLNEDVAELLKRHDRLNRCAVHSLMEFAYEALPLLSSADVDFPLMPRLLQEIGRALGPFDESEVWPARHTEVAELAYDRIQAERANNPLRTLEP